MIYDDYIQYSEEYRQKYGKQTVVLMEVGSFFEIYAVQNKYETSGADIATVCDLCNLQLSRKNKAVVENSRTNPLMAGFPSFALAKHTQLLLANGFTVVLVRQVTPPPNPKREVTEILSPGLILTPQGSDGSWLVVSFWDKHTSALNVGFCGVDVSTGETWVYEVSGTSLSLDEIARCMSVYQPREIVIIGSQNLTDTDKETILGALGSYGQAQVHVLWDAVYAHGAKYAYVPYQNAVLAKAYNADDTFGMLSPLEALDLERLDNVRTALTFMVQFGFEHNPAIIKKLKKPIHLSFDMRCNLEHTSAVQLQLIGGSGSCNGGEKPLLSILNRCATAFGARALKARLLQPTHDKALLMQRYDEIDYCINHTDYMSVYGALRGVLDLERMARRITLATFSPTDWTGLHTSLEAILEAATNAKRPDIIDVVRNLMSGYEHVLDLTECAKYLTTDIRGTVFKVGVFADIDDATQRHNAARKALADLATQLSTYGEGCKVEFNDRDGYTIQVTKRRWDVIKKVLPSTFGVLSFKPGEFEARSISPSSNVVKLLHPWIQEQSDQILKTNHSLTEIVTKSYKEFLTEFGEKHNAAMAQCVQLTSHMDITVTCARNAVDFKYIRPSLNATADTDVAGAWFDARSLRHPILERLNEQTMYVPNDVSLNCPDSNRGLLLFGVNSSGKSSLMKAIGLNVIMAQAGMYVAAETFTYEPYKHVFTRIAGTDDIYRGWSTFTVEMMELRNILMRSDRFSLVLGDELCSGTESLSATAIVAAGIETLATQGVSFVFATHLHDLSKMKCIANRPDVLLSHMHVEWESDKLVYDRRLRPGVGSGVYGLEVCRGLNLPSEFLKKAHDIRCELEGKSSHFVDPRSSRYNSKVFMDTCKICGAAAPKETHHISPQVLSDAQGFIDHYHKNSVFNLITVCEACHDSIHNPARARAQINGYVATSQGIQLQVGVNGLSAGGSGSGNLQKARQYVRFVHSLRAWETRKTIRSIWRKETSSDAIKCALSKYGFITQDQSNAELQAMFCDVA